MNTQTQSTGPVGQIQQAPSMPSQSLFALQAPFRTNSALPTRRANPIPQRQNGIIMKLQPAPNASKITTIYNQDRYSQQVQQVQNTHQQVPKASQSDQYEAKEMNTDTLQGLFGNPGGFKMKDNYPYAEDNKYLSTNEMADFFKMSTSPAFSEQGLINNIKTGGIFGMSSSPAVRVFQDFTIQDFVEQSIPSYDNLDLSKVDMHEKLAGKFNKQIFKTVMTASIAQQKMGQIVQKVKLPEMQQKHQLRPIPIPVEKNGHITANGGSIDYDDNLIRRSDKNILYKAQTSKIM